MNMATPLSLQHNDGFWDRLLSLQRQLIGEERLIQLLNDVEQQAALVQDLSKENVARNQDFETRNSTVQKIDNVINNVMLSVASTVNPSVSFANRATWKNVRFQPGHGLEMIMQPIMTTVTAESDASMRKLDLIMRVLSLMKHHIERNTYCTKRDLFYQDPTLFGTQACLDSIVDDISLLLKVPRWQLHIMATSKGLVSGDLQFRDFDGNYIDCRRSGGGVLIPNHVHRLTNLYSSARFVLVVEKDATFQKLVADRITQKLGPCIVITGKGFPDVNTRLLLRLLWTTFQIPTLALVDADPHGMEIMAVYKFGSRSMCFEGASLTVPSLRWIGVLPSDIEKMHIPCDALISLSAADRKKAIDLLQRDYITAQPYWKDELEILLRTGHKAEIQCLDAISHNFLSDVYLPNKIRFGGWI